jgi:hypothetical protein
MKQKGLLAAAILLGVLIAYIDSRPTWDDTGITVLTFLVGGGIIGMLVEKRPWLYALALGLWLPLWYLLSTHHGSMLILLAIPFLGVYIGWAVRHAIRRLRPAE